MPKFYDVKDITIEQPSDYRIIVLGNLDKSWSDRLAGMRITTIEEDDKKPKTTLEGRVRDQAELAGVLNSLYELHLPILSVELIAID